MKAQNNTRHCGRFAASSPGAITNPDTERSARHETNHEPTPSISNVDLESAVIGANQPNIARHNTKLGTAMLLENKNAIIDGAAGAVGGAVARAFAREGARIFLTGRNPSALAKLAEEISAAGGLAETAEVDALNEHSATCHLDAVVEKVGAVDVSFNAIGIPQHGIQGIPLTQRLARHSNFFSDLRHRQTIADHGHHGLIPLLGHAQLPHRRSVKDQPK